MPNTSQPTKILCPECMKAKLICIEPGCFCPNCHMEFERTGPMGVVYKRDKTKERQR